MNILFLFWGAYTEQDLVEEFSQRGIKCDIITYPFKGKDKNHNEEFERLFSNKLKENTYNAAFSINYFPIMAQICHDCNLTYLSWSYDAPLNVRNIEETLGYSTNRAFFFDKAQANTYQALGFSNCYHLPLGIPMRRLQKVKKDAKMHNSISFIGNLYTSSYPQVASALSSKTRGYLRGLMDSQRSLYGCYLLDTLVTDSLVQEVNKELAASLGQAAFHITMKELVYLMSTQITFEERHILLGLLSQHFPVSLYSKEGADLLKNVIQKGPVSYRNEMPTVFASSDINLNITHKMLISGIPLRALDILGCGGFLLSNYQPELAEYLIEGCEWVAYSSMEDAYEKCAFYLQREDLRVQIAENGRKKAQELFDYPVLLKQLFEYAGLGC